MAVSLIDSFLSRRNIMSVIDEISAERSRQIEVEGWTPEHDDNHDAGDLTLAASVYCLLASSEIMPEESHDIDAACVNATKWIWPWSPQWLKRSTPRRMLIKSAALIVAEIERMDRAENNG